MTATSSPGLVESYWVEPGQLMAGEYPAINGRLDAAERIDALLDAGIDTFFDLTEPEELAPYLMLLQERAARRDIRVTHRRFPIVDFSLPTHSTMLAVLDGLDAASAAGRCVYLHCRGGVGRTGMAVGCYLVRRGLTGGQAIRQIDQYWRSDPARRYVPISPETPEQLQFVLDWSEPGQAGRR
jgi:hypothetical protein